MRRTHEAALVLARRAVDLGKGHRLLGHFQMAVGMAEYRSGHYAAADAALLAASELGKNIDYVSGTTAFYRAMSLFRQGKESEARKLASEAFAEMKPLPADEKFPWRVTSMPTISSSGWPIRKPGRCSSRPPQDRAGSRSAPPPLEAVVRSPFAVTALPGVRNLDPTNGDEKPPEKSFTVPRAAGASRTGLRRGGVGQGRKSAAKAFVTVRETLFITQFNPTGPTEP